MRDKRVIVGKVFLKRGHLTDVNYLGFYSLTQRHETPTGEYLEIDEESDSPKDSVPIF